MQAAVIFDMDGVLIDTEPLNDQHMVAYLKKYGIEVTHDYFQDFRGTTAQHLWTHLIKKYNLKTPIDELIADVRKSYINYLSSLNTLKPITGIPRLLKTIMNEKIPMAVASSAYKKRLHMLLDSCKLTSFFPIIVSGDDIHHSKPHPEIYLKTANLLQISPNLCIVFEDATNGVIAGKTAGMKVVGFKSKHSKQDLSKADIVVSNFEDITPSILKNLLQFTTKKRKLKA